MPPKKPTSGRRNASIRLTRNRLCNHHNQHHSIDITNMNKRTKVDDTVYQSMSTPNELNEIGNDDSTTTTTDKFFFPYDRRESTDYFANNASTETPNKGPSYLVVHYLLDSHYRHHHIYCIVVPWLPPVHLIFYSELWEEANNWGYLQMGYTG